MVKHREQLNKCFQKMISQSLAWSANAYREAHTVAVSTLRSLRLDATIWGGIPHVSKLQSYEPCNTQGSICANCLRAKYYMLKNGKPADKIMKKMDGKHGPLGHQRRRNHDPSTNRSNVAEIFEKKSRRNDKNAHKLQQWNTKDAVHNILQTII